MRFTAGLAAGEVAWVDLFDKGAEGLDELAAGFDAVLGLVPFGLEGVEFLEAVGVDEEGGLVDGLHPAVLVVDRHGVVGFIWAGDGGDVDVGLEVVGVG